MLVNLVQSENAPYSILVTLDDSSMLVNPVQPLNALLPILVTLDGSSMLVNPVQYWNAASPILVTLPSVGITLVLQPDITVLLAVCIKQFPALWYIVFPLATVILVNPVQP